MQQSKKQLLHKISKSDDEQAFQLLFEMYFERLLKFSDGYVKDLDAAKDVLADVFISLWVNRSRLNDVENFDSYVFKCVKNQSLKHIQNNKRRPQLPLGDGGTHFYIDNYTPEMAFEFKELRGYFEDAIEQLPEQCRIVFRLIKLEKLKYKEVSEILGISVKTVDAHLVKAIRRLREMFDEHHLSKKTPKTKLKKLN